MGSVRVRWASSIWVSSPMAQVSAASSTNWTWVSPNGRSAARMTACQRFVTRHSMNPGLSRSESYRLLSGLLTAPSPRL